MLDDTALPVPAGGGRKTKHGAAAKSAPAPRPRQKREPQVSKSAIAAMELLSSGKAQSIADAAKQLGRSRENIYRQLAKPHVKLWMLSNLKLDVVMSAGRAWGVKRSLLDAQSEHVRNACASEILALSGIQAPKAPAVAVSIDNRQSVGYILNLSGRSHEELVASLAQGGRGIFESGKLLDIEPEPQSA